MPDESDTLLLRTLHRLVTDLLDWLGHWPADAVRLDALAALKDGVDWIVHGLPAEQRRRLASLAPAARPTNGSLTTWTRRC